MLFQFQNLCVSLKTLGNLEHEKVVRVYGRFAANVVERWVFCRPCGTSLCIISLHFLGLCLCLDLALFYGRGRWKVENCVIWCHHFQSYVHSGHNVCTNAWLSHGESIYILRSAPLKIGLVTLVASPDSDPLKHVAPRATTKWRQQYHSSAPSLFLFYSGGNISFAIAKFGHPGIFSKEKRQISLMYWCWASGMHNVFFFHNRVWQVEHCHQI